MPSPREGKPPRACADRCEPERGPLDGAGWFEQTYVVVAPSPTGCARKFQRTTALDPLGAVCDRYHTPSDAVVWRWACSCRRHSTKLWKAPHRAYGPSRAHARRCFGRVRVEPVIVLPTCGADGSNPALEP